VLTRDLREQLFAATSDLARCARELRGAFSIEEASVASQEALLGRVRGLPVEGAPDAMLSLQQVAEQAV
jgi:hypothetical protein